MAMEDVGSTEGELSKMFHGFMKSVIRYSILNALRSHMVKVCRESLIPIEYLYDIPEETTLPYIEKISVDLFVTVVYISDCNLAAALKTLPTQQKTVIGYYYVLDLEPKEIARKLRISPHGVYTHKGRALKKLRKEMISRGDGYG